MTCESRRYPIHGGDDTAVIGGHHRFGIEFGRPMDCFAVYQGIPGTPSPGTALRSRHATRAQADAAMSRLIADDLRLSRETRDAGLRRYCRANVYRVVEPGDTAVWF